VDSIEPDKLAPFLTGADIQNPFIDKMNGFLDNLNSSSPKITPDIYPRNLNRLCNHLDSNDLIQDRLNDWAIDINLGDYYQWLNNQNRTDHGVITWVPAM